MCTLPGVCVCLIGVNWQTDSAADWQLLTHLGIKLLTPSAAVEANDSKQVWCCLLVLSVSTLDLRKGPDWLLLHLSKSWDGLKPLLLQLPTLFNLFIFFTPVHWPWLKWKSLVEAEGKTCILSESPEPRCTKWMAQHRSRKIRNNGASCSASCTMWMCVNLT